MPLTCSKALEAFNHVVNIWFQVLKEGSLYKALEKSGDTREKPVDTNIRDMILPSDTDIDSLTYDKSETDKDVSFSKRQESLSHF